MPTKTIEEKVEELSQEVATLRLLVIGLATTRRDSEGEYRPEFVKRVLKLARNKSAGVRFTTSSDFLKRIS